MGHRYRIPNMPAAIRELSHRVDTLEARHEFRYGPSTLMLSGEVLTIGWDYEAHKRILVVRFEEDGKAFVPGDGGKPNWPPRGTPVVITWTEP